MRFEWHAARKLLWSDERPQRWGRCWEMQSSKDVSPAWEGKGLGHDGNPNEETEQSPDGSAPVLVLQREKGIDSNGIRPVPTAEAPFGLPRHPPKATQTRSPKHWPFGDLVVKHGRLIWILSPRIVTMNGLINTAIRVGVRWRRRVAQVTPKSTTKRMTRSSVGTRNTLTEPDRVDHHMAGPV